MSLVTPRVPLHLDYRNSSCVEMRYVRFEEHSLKVALLLALYEEASLPSATELRDFLRRCLGRQLAEYLHLSLTCKSHKFVTAWNNSEEFLHTLFMWWGQFPLPTKLSDIAQFLQDEFNVSVEWNAGSSQLIFSTFFVSLQKTNEVVILYRYYQEGSFLRASCGHLHLISDLCGKMNSLTQGRCIEPSDFEKLQLLCSVDDCQQNLAGWLLKYCLKDSEEKSNEVEIWLTSMRPSVAERDCCNSNPVTPTAFHCDHRMCRNCLTIALLCAPPYCCRICRAPMRMEYLTNSQALQNIFSVKAPLILLACMGCEKSLEPLHYSKVRSADHRCRICDECLNFSSLCPNCNQLIPSDFFQPETLRIDVCEICCVRKDIYDCFVCCKIEHGCFYCDACAYGGSLDLPPNCVQCKKTYKKSERRRVASGQRERSLESIVCLCCKTDRSISAFSVSTQLSHWWKCRVCDECFDRSTHSSTCLSCSKSFTRTDLRIINNHFHS